MSWLKKLGQAFSRRNLWIVFLYGFSSGLPLLLTGGTLKTWLAREQVDISTIGYFSWVGLAYSLKFLWAPLLDRYRLFFFGRRRSWILATQIVIALLIFQISQLSPHESLGLMAALAVVIGFFSATQDIAIDAYRREILKDEELGIGSSLTNYGYRIAMYVSGAIGMGFVGSDFFNLSWNGLYVMMGIIMAGTTLITFFAPEPPGEEQFTPKTLKSAVIDSFKEFLTRDKAIAILIFVFLFKLGDALSASLLNPFYVEIGYTNADIAFIAKTVGMAFSIFGLFLGGVLLFKIGILRSLWIFGILQGLSTAGFSLITFTGPEKWALALAVIFEDISSGMGNAAFLAYISTITDKRFTGTQFALLSAIATSGRNIFSGFAGVAVKSIGWAPFFWLCGLIAIPGLFMLWYLQKSQKSKS